MEEYAQAEAGYRPTIGVKGSYGYDNNSAGTLGPSVTDSTSGALTFSQPLYTGGQVASQVNAAEADILCRSRVPLRRTEISMVQSGHRRLLLDVRGISSSC